MGDNKKHKREEMDSVFHGLGVPDGQERRNLYTSQIRTIWTYKLALSDMDQLVREQLSKDGWEIVQDERKGFAGKMDVKKEETVVHVQMEPCSSSAMSALKYFVDY